MSNAQQAPSCRPISASNRCSSIGSGAPGVSGAISTTARRAERGADLADELGRRERAYRGDRPPADPQGKTTILVDDGIATGASMLASIRAVRAAGPESIVVAVPVGPRSTCSELRHEADDIVCVNMPIEFDAVGQVYADFRQVSDEEVREVLNTPTR